MEEPNLIQRPNGMTYRANVIKSANRINVIPRDALTVDRTDITVDADTITVDQTDI